MSSSSHFSSRPLSPLSSSFPSAESSSLPSATTSASPLLPTHATSSLAASHFPLNVPSRSGKRGHSALGLRRISNPISRGKPASILANFGSRAFRTLKSRDGLTLVLFVSALCYFFAALCGVGYVDASSAPAWSVDHAKNETLPEFAVAKPLLSQPEVVGDKTQKELEESWKKMVRGTNDGAWLRPKRLTRRSTAGKPAAVVGSEDTEALDWEVVSGEDDH